MKISSPLMRYKLAFLGILFIGVNTLAEEYDDCVLYMFGYPKPQYIRSILSQIEIGEIRHIFDNKPQQPIAKTITLLDKEAVYNSAVRKTIPPYDGIYHKHGYDVDSALGAIDDPMEVIKRVMYELSSGIPDPGESSCNYRVIIRNYFGLIGFKPTNYTFINGWFVLEFKLPYGVENITVFKVDDKMIQKIIFFRTLFDQ